MQKPCQSLTLKVFVAPQACARWTRQVWDAAWFTRRSYQTCSSGWAEIPRCVWFLCQLFPFFLFPFTTTEMMNCPYHHWLLFDPDWTSPLSSRGYPLQIVIRPDLMSRPGYVMLGGLPIPAGGVAWGSLYVLHHCTGTKADVLSTCGLIHSGFCS